MTPTTGVLPDDAMSSDSEDTGRTPSVAQLPAAGIETLEDSEEVQSDCETQHASDNLAILHALMGTYTRQLWDIQKLDTAVTNRVEGMDRDGLSLYVLESQAVLAGIDTVRRDLEKKVQLYAKKHPLWPWIKATPGISYGTFAGLIAVTGSLDRFSTVSKLWKYLGLSVSDGHAPKAKKGVAWTHTNCRGGHLQRCKTDCKTDHHPNCTSDGFGTAYSAQGRVVCHMLGESIAKLKPGNGPYRAAYDVKKAYYEVERPDWTQQHRHQAAMRYAVKCLIRDMWVEWRRCPVDAHRTIVLLHPTADHAF